MKRQEIINQIARVLKSVVPNAKSIVYGSEARGESTSDSDIDLLILLDDNDIHSPERELEITRHLYEIEVNTGVIISPMIMLQRVWDKIKTPFSINVNNEGIVI